MGISRISLKCSHKVSLFLANDVRYSGSSSSPPHFIQRLSDCPQVKMNWKGYSLASDGEFSNFLSQVCLLINVFVEVFYAKAYVCTESSIPSTN